MRRRSRRARSTRSRMPCGSSPGVTVSRSGSAGGLTSLFPRGGESDLHAGAHRRCRGQRVRRGVRLRASRLGRRRALEIVRGPQSALYGGGAIGAVVVGRHPARGSCAGSTDRSRGAESETWRVDGSAAGMRDGWTGSIAARAVRERRLHRHCARHRRGRQQRGLRAPLRHRRRGLARHAGRRRPGPCESCRRTSADSRVRTVRIRSATTAVSIASRAA